MSSGTIRILAVEDNPVDVLRLKEEVRHATTPRFEIYSAETLSEAKELLGQGEFQIILLDLGLPDSQGLVTLLDMGSFAAEIPVVVLSGIDDETLAIEAGAKGAQDYICKDRWDSRLIVRSLSYAIERNQILSECKRANEASQAALKALRESEERFRAIFMRTADHISVRDREGNYIQVNPAFESLVGRTTEKIIGRRAEDLFGKDTGQFAAEIDSRVLQGESVDGERTLWIRGVPVTLSYNFSPLRDSTGAVVGIFSITRDITDRKRVELPDRKSFHQTYPSTAMRSTLKQAMMAAQRDSTVLLLGESGSGKDWLAKYIHNHSGRSGGPFSLLNCAAISRELAESELFGHERGAFTGASSRKRGLLELAEGGTLLLNEIGELPLPLQAKLLTFLDTRKFTRLGGETQVSSNARLIAATNRDLDKEVEKGGFRRDLFYRFNVLRIEVPPLRDREEDIPMLAEEILSELATSMQFSSVPSLDASTMDALVRYQWPGNVRELRNVLERTLILGDEEHFDVMLPKPTSEQKEQEMKVAFRDRTLHEVTDEVTRVMCLDALRHCNGNKKEAAKRLGIARDSLYRYLNQFGILSANDE